jgi:hypothetical protein
MENLKMFLLGAATPLAFYFLILLLDYADKWGKKMDCCDYECNEGHNCPIRRTPLPQKEVPVCPPCTGDCRQGRDCPANKEVA